MDTTMMLDCEHCELNAATVRLKAEVAALQALLSVQEELLKREHEKLISLAREVVTERARRDEWRTACEDARDDAKTHRALVQDMADYLKTWAHISLDRIASDALIARALMLCLD